MKETTHIIHISTDGGTRCKLCGPQADLVFFDKLINHYIEQHGYKLLHVGTETSREKMEGKLYHSTVAVLGH
jgi:hypothetical protein